MWKKASHRNLLKRSEHRSDLIRSILSRLSCQCPWITGLRGILKLYKCLLYLYLHRWRAECRSIPVVLLYLCTGTRGLSSPSWPWAAAPLPSHTERVQWRTRSSGQAGLGQTSHPGPQQWAVGPRTAGWQRPALGLWRSVLPAKLGMRLQRLEWALQSQFTGCPRVA